MYDCFIYNIFKLFCQYKTSPEKGDVLLARAVGIEPTLEVLETPVLPLYYARKKERKRSLFGFSVKSMFACFFRKHHKLKSSF